MILVAVMLIKNNLMLVMSYDEFKFYLISMLVYIIHVHVC